MSCFNEGRKSDCYRILSVILWLGLLAGCVTHTKPSTVSIQTTIGASIYPPLLFQGQWVSREQILIFGHPPQPAVSVTSTEQGRMIEHAYDIITIKHNEEGHLQMTLRAHRSTEPLRRRTFRPPVQNRLLEIQEDGTERLWIKTGH